MFSLRSLNDNRAGSISSGPKSDGGGEAEFDGASFLQRRLSLLPLA